MQVKPSVLSDTAPIAPSSLHMLSTNDLYHSTPTDFCSNIDATPTELAICSLYSKAPTTMDASGFMCPVPASAQPNIYTAPLFNCYVMSLTPGEADTATVGLQQTPPAAARRIKPAADDALRLSAPRLRAVNCIHDTLHHWSNTSLTDPSHRAQIG